MARTYTELVADLQEWMEDNDLEFQTAIPRIINLAELRVVKDLDLGIFKEDQTAPTVISNEAVSHPATTLQLVSFKSIYIDFDPGSGTRRYWLELRGSDYVRDFQDPGSTGLPKYYAEEDGRFLLAPIPDAIYTLNCRALVRPVPLGPSQDTNWLTDTVDELLFKACKAESEEFLKGDERLQVWLGDYQSHLATTKRDTYTLLGEHYNMTPLEPPAVPTNQR